MDEIVQSTEHSIEKTFVRFGSENKIEGTPPEVDKTGRVEIRIDDPTAEFFHVTITDDMYQTTNFILSIEGADALMNALMRMLDWRQIQVQEEQRLKQGGVVPVPENKAVTEARENAQAALKYYKKQ